MNDDIPQQIEHRCQSVTHPLSKRFCESFPLRKPNIYPLETKLKCEGNLPPPPPPTTWRCPWQPWVETVRNFKRQSAVWNLIFIFGGKKGWKTWGIYCKFTRVSYIVTFIGTSCILLDYCLARLIPSLTKILSGQNSNRWMAPSWTRSRFSVFRKHFNIINNYSTESFNYAIF